jgi:small-conductance mechanosensitive channel
MNPVDWLEKQFLGSSLQDWGIAIGAALLAWLVLGLARRLVRGRLKVLAERTDSAPLDVAEHVVGETRGWFLLILSLYIGTRFGEWSPRVETILDRTLMLALLLQAGLWATAALGAMLSLRRKRQLEQDPGDVAALDVVGFIARVGLWTVVLLLALDNFGVNITALVAGLGVGGIAVALAAQNILGDLFASLSIVLDKPFVVGDFLVIGDFMGSVEKVGIKTTRVRSLSGDQLIFSNNDLLGSRIRNYGRMYERRVVFSLGVVYQTPADKLRKIPEIIRETVESQSDVRFDRAHFQKYGDSSLLFEVVYYVLSPDYNRYMDIQQAINLEIFERFASEEIEFAYPTRTLFLNRTGADSSEDDGGPAGDEPAGS